MSYIVVDVEADGAIPGKYNMLSFGAVVVEPTLSKTFESGPITQMFPRCDLGAITAIGLSTDDYRKLHVLGGAEPIQVMKDFDIWIEQTSKGRPIFMSDNNGFDWQFINWYFIHCLNRNPFGYSSRRIGDLYAGLMKDVHVSWKHLRKTKHTHNPLDDAMGNAEVVLHMKEHMGLNIQLR